MLDAVRLQLSQYLPAGPFGFVVSRSKAGDAVVAWAWPIDADMRSPRRGGGWAETALDEPAQGLRLVRRSAGFEAQRWSDGELLHSRWFDTMPAPAEWQRFVRGCGADPQDHPLPEPSVAPPLRRPARDWLAGDNLPAVDHWRGWRWQVALLLAGSVIAAAVGVHLQTRQQLRIDTERLQALSGGRAAALQARARYEQAASDLEALRALVPKLSQLELLDRVSASGIFSPAAKPDSAKPVKAPPSPVPGMATATSLPEPAAARLLDWDYRNGQLKMTLELPERDVTLLDITRRLETVPGLGALRVGQDNTGNTLTLTASIAALAPPPVTGVDAARAKSAIR
jgi:hypothetical protein